MNDLPLATVPDHAKVAIRVVSRVSGNKPRTFTRIFPRLADAQRALAKLTSAAATAGRAIEVFLVASWCDADGIHDRRWQINSTRMTTPAVRDWPFAPAPPSTSTIPATPHLIELIAR